MSAYKRSYDVMGKGVEKLAIIVVGTRALSTALLTHSRFSTTIKPRAISCCSLADMGDMAYPANQFLADSAK